MEQNQFFTRQYAALEMVEKFVAFAGDMMSDGDSKIIVQTSIPQIQTEFQGHAAQLQEHTTLKHIREQWSSLPFLFAAQCVIDTPSIRQGQPGFFRVEYSYDPKTTRRRVFKFVNINDAGTAIRVLTTMAKHFELMSSEASVIDELGSIEQRSLEFRQQTVERFAAEVSRLGVFVTEQAEKNARLVTQQTDVLEQRYQQREDELANRMQAERDALAVERKTHQAEIEKFETRTNTYVRRDINTKLENILKEFAAIDVQKKIADKRLGIHILCISALSMSAVLGGYAAWKISNMADPQWFHILPFSAAAVTFVSTLIFYLKWSHAWFNRLASAEFAHRKAKVDVARAAWIAELLFEWKEKKDVGLPDDVLRSLTTNLFQDPNRDGERLHPVDQVSGLLEGASRVKVGSIEFSRRRRSKKTETNGKAE